MSKVLPNESAQFRLCAQICAEIDQRFIFKACNTNQYWSILCNNVTKELIYNAPDIQGHYFFGQGHGSKIALGDISQYF